MIKSTLLMFFASAALLLAANDYRVLTRYPVPGTGGWDYVTLDEQARRLYVSHATQVEVLDADTGKMIGTISDTPGVHGVAIATGLKRGFTSNGRENTVSMFEPETLKLINKIEVGKGPDGIYYEPKTKRIFTNNHGTHDITAIDAVKGAVVGTVKVEGDGEQAIIAKDGLIYVNLEDRAEVAAFDARTLEVKKRYPIGVAETPTGLAYDPATNRLFIGCRKEPKMVVMDAATGKVLANFPIGSGVDFAGFDPKSKLAFFSCGDGNLNMFRVKSASAFEDLGAVKTQPSAKTLAFDSKTGKIFLPAAEYEQSAPAEPGRRPQRKVKPGSFVVVVVGK
jgi:DNA-binding beta-propeller fold protein YncE